MLALLVFVSLQAHAGQVLLQGPHTSAIEYKGMLKAHPKLSSPVQEYMGSHPLPANRERLLGLFSEAQKSFLEKSSEDSAVRFKSLLALLSEDDWEKSDREIFLQAYLRLAQMEENPEARERWLGQSLLLGPGNIDADLYPPPLLAKRAELEKRLPKKDAARKLFAQGWSEVLINGRSCQDKACSALVLYPGTVRVTVLSDQWAAQSSIVDLAEVERYSPKTEAWAEGDCAQNSLTRAGSQYPEAKVFWGLTCEKPELTAYALKPSSKSDHQALPLFTSAAPQSKPLLKSAWFWGGVAAVAVVVVVASAKKKR